MLRAREWEIRGTMVSVLGASGRVVVYCIMSFRKMEVENEVCWSESLFVEIRIVLRRI